MESIQGYYTEIKGKVVLFSNTNNNYSIDREEITCPTCPDGDESLQDYVFANRTTVKWKEAVTPEFIYNIVYHDFNELGAQQFYDSFISGNIFSKAQVKAVLERGANHYLPGAISALTLAEVNDSKEKCSFLIDLAVEGGCAEAAAYKTLPVAVAALKNKGINDPKQIIKILRDIMVIAQQYTKEAYYALPDILNSGRTTSPKICALLSSISTGTFEELQGAYNGLPAMMRAEVSAPSFVYKMLKAKLPVSAFNIGLAYEAAPGIIAAGISDPAILCRLISGVVATDWPYTLHTGVSLKLLAENIPLIKAIGIIDQMEIANLLIEIAAIGGREHTHIALAKVSSVLDTIKQEGVTDPTKTYKRLKLKIEASMRDESLIKR